MILNMESGPCQKTIRLFCVLSESYSVYICLYKVYHYKQTAYSLTSCYLFHVWKLSQANKTPQAKHQQGGCSKLFRGEGSQNVMTFLRNPLPCKQLVGKLYMSLIPNDVKTCQSTQEKIASLQLYSPLGSPYEQRSKRAAAWSTQDWTLCTARLINSSLDSKQLQRLQGFNGL